MKKKSVWVHKKIKGEWVSSYLFTKQDRVFTLSRLSRVLSYESWQAAMSAGWKKKVSK